MTNGDWGKYDVPAGGGGRGGGRWGDNSAPPPSGGWIHPLTRTRINCIFILKFSFLFTLTCSGNFQFYFGACHLLDPYAHLSVRIRIKEASDYADPKHWSGTLVPTAERLSDLWRNSSTSSMVRTTGSLILLSLSPSSKNGSRGTRTKINTKLWRFSVRIRNNESEFSPI